MNLAGLDLSLTSTGLATAVGDHLLTAPRLRGVERLTKLRDLVLDIVRADDVRLVALEDYAFSRAHAHAHELGELGGVVKVALHEAGVLVVLVGPSALKKFATGRGNATKPDMRTARLQRTGVDQRDDNLNDAWWLLQLAMHAYVAAGAVSLPAAQLQVVGSITWPSIGAVA